MLELFLWINVLTVISFQYYIAVSYLISNKKTVTLTPTDFKRISIEEEHDLGETIALLVLLMPCAFHMLVVHLHEKRGK